MVLDVLHGPKRSTSLCVYYLEEEPPVDPHRWLGEGVNNRLIPLLIMIQGMQLFNFIFLARSWVSDRVQLENHLSRLAKQAEEEDSPFCFILYPEGTLVSENTRPISKKFADKMGIVSESCPVNIRKFQQGPQTDMRNVLLPRSTGLHYTLRSLASRIPDLCLIDLTVVYPGA